MAEQNAGTRILVIGESLVDVVEGDASASGSNAASTSTSTSTSTASSPSTSTEHVGGSPLNIAYGLARLGRPVELLTAIGPDARGTAITEHLDAAGVAVLPASNRTEPTSTATARLRADGSADYVFDLRWSLPIGSIELAEELEPAIVHTGSIAAFLEPGGAAIVELLSALAGSEHPPLVTFDPNMRPSIITDHASAFERFTAIAALTDVLKLSDEDAEWLFPNASVDEALDRILALGPALVAVTRGGDGAILATARDRVAVPGVRVEVADTIGAGDSFMSALIFSLAALLDASASTPGATSADDPSRGGAPAEASTSTWDASGGGAPADASTSTSTWDASRGGASGGGAFVDALRSGTAFDAAGLDRLGAFSVRCAAVTVSRAGANPPTLAEVAPA